MSMPDHIILSDRFYKNFLPRRFLMLLENGKTGLFCFTRVGEPAHIENILLIWSRGSVARGEG